jgi:hypothetical protein
MQGTKFWGPFGHSPPGRNSFQKSDRNIPGASPGPGNFRADIFFGGKPLDLRLSVAPGTVIKKWPTLNAASLSDGDVGYRRMFGGKVRVRLTKAQTKLP